MNELFLVIHDVLRGSGRLAIEAAVLIALGWVLFWLFSRAIKTVAENGYLDYQLRVIIGNLVKWLLIAVVALIILDLYGVSVGTLWAALSGVLALIALGFVAVWSVLSNVSCSILLIVFAPFRINDEIDIQEPTANFSLRGKVVSINMLFTTLEVENSDTTDERPTLLRVPNNIFFQKYVRCIPGKRTESLQKYMARQQDQS